MTAIIEFKDVEKRYDNEVILHQLNLAIDKGEFLTVIGSSGCGKTTLLKMINGLILPESGQVLVDGMSIKNTDLIALRRSIGYCIQGSVLFPHMSVEDNISYVLHLLKKYDKTKINDIVTSCLKTVGLKDDIRFRYPSELSGGQQQRVGIARALAASPDILLMDEPFGAVDSITRTQLQRELKTIHQRSEVTIVFITHDIAEALYLGTKVLVLDKGVIQQYDTPQHILEHPANEFVKQLLEHSLHKGESHNI